MSLSKFEPVCQDLQGITPLSLMTLTTQTTAAAHDCEIVNIMSTRSLTGSDYCCRKTILHQNVKSILELDSIRLTLVCGKSPSLCLYSCGKWHFDHGLSLVRDGICLYVAV